MAIRRRIKWRYFLILVTFIVLYNEFIIHWIQPFKWNSMTCGNNDKTCVKFLLVADPQIQGELAVSPPLSWLFNWDSDRYVKHTFAVAMTFLEPDVVIYLGDLMDEGSKATKEEFDRYIKRLMGIFYKARTNNDITNIWVPGDNDIGGENERVSMDALRNFEFAFDSADVHELDHYNDDFDFVAIYKVNRIAHIMPTIPDDHYITKDNFNIIVSHYPMLGTGIFAQRAIQQLHPDLFFSGHHHTANYYKMAKNASVHTKYAQNILPGAEVLHIQFDNNTYHEINVPTCSYRMGVHNMGYGAAILERNHLDMRYQVLWSSSRFPVLYSYLFTLIVTSVFMLVHYAVRLRRKLF